MKNLITILFFIIIFQKSFSQVGIGTTTPEGILDIYSTNTGVVFPKIALTNKTTSNPVINPNGGNLSIGTIVYNTATSGTYPNNVKPGYYYWDGSKWESFVKENFTINSTQSNPIAEPINGIEYTATNTTNGNANVSTLTRNATISGAVGTITSVKCNVKYTSPCHSDIALYLKSPNGQIINLKRYLGPCDSTSGTQGSFDVTYTDQANSNLPNNWVLTSGVSGDFKPTGDMFTNNITNPAVTPNISTMAGFNGQSPNGTWTLYFKDDIAVDVSIFDSFTVYVTVNTSNSYKLIGETSLLYSSGGTVIVNSTYSANLSDDFGMITALTRTTSSVGALGTTVTTLPQTVLSYSSDSPSSGTGNLWAHTSNQAVCSNLTSGVTYYYQLWAKGNVEAPNNSNQQFSLIAQQN